MLLNAEHVDRAAGFVGLASLRRPRARAPQAETRRRHLGWWLLYRYSGKSRPTVADVARLVGASAPFLYKVFACLRNPADLSTDAFWRLGQLAGEYKRASIAGRPPRRVLSAEQVDELYEILNDPDAPVRRQKRAWRQRQKEGAR